MNFIVNGLASFPGVVSVGIDDHLMTSARSLAQMSQPLSMNGLQGFVSREQCLGSVFVVIIAQEVRYHMGMFVLLRLVSLAGIVCILSFSPGCMLISIGNVLQITIKW